METRASKPVARLESAKIDVAKATIDLGQSLVKTGLIDPKKIEEILKRRLAEKGVVLW